MLIWHSLFSRFCHRKLRIWSFLLKKSLMENFFFCAVTITGKTERPKTENSTFPCKTVLSKANVKTNKMGSTKFFFGNFVSVYEPLIKSWFDVTTNQMSILAFFVSAGVLFEGAFSLWVCLNRFSVLSKWSFWNQFSLTYLMCSLTLV